MFPLQYHQRPLLPLHWSTLSSRFRFALEEAMQLIKVRSVYNTIHNRSCRPENDSRVHNAAARKCDGFARLSAVCISIAVIRAIDGLSRVGGTCISF